MGIVYEAYDRQREMVVALKTLRHLDDDNLRRLKREFRSLADLSHPNIIQFYELICKDEMCLLVMELVRGADFIEYVRGFRTPVLSAPALRKTTTQATLTMRDTFIPPRPKIVAACVHANILPIVPPTTMALDEVVDIERLRSALGQLADALLVLHTHNMVHRDLKPANVRVESNGSVVLMDFGIVGRLAHAAGDDTGRIAGTPGYMAPEQVRPGRPRPASDWYAFGVLMYVALTGRLPFEGDPRDVMRHKGRVEPWPPSRFTHGIPPDLENLCIRLLSADPTRRPHGNDVLDQLGVTVSDATASGEFRILDSDIELFVGRRRELDALRRAYATAQSGQACCVFIEGMAGCGRSSLARRFLFELDTLGQRPVILSGHSWARESLAYKAFDGIVDDLAKYLLSLTEPARRALLVDDARAITWLFPSLERVFPQAEPAPERPPDAYDQRAHAIVALRALLERIAGTRTVVLYTDDVQWADSDSLDLLLALMRRPVTPRLLILVTLRTEEDHQPADPDARQQIERLLDALENEVDCRHLHLGPLSDREQREFINRASRLPEFEGMKTHIDAPLWREAGGNPMLLAELARSTTDTPHELAAHGQLHLDDVIWSRYGKLPDEARALLECIVLAGEPLPLRVLAVASELSGVACERATSTLRVSHLVRIERSDHEPWLVAYHFKVCEAVKTHLPEPHRIALHRRIAHALEEWPEAPHALLAEQWLAAGEPLVAARHHFEAAREAAYHLALERATKSYRATLELISEPTEDRELALICCRARIGLVETVLHDQGDREQAMALLERAHQVAREYRFIAELAQIHHLLGSLQFPDGDLDACRAEHERAREYARMSSSPRLEALALAGEGDAFYARGRILSAHSRFEECLTLCRDHGLRDISVNYRPMRALTRYFRGDLSGALRDGRDAADGAARIRYQRTELIARCLPMSWALFDMGRLSHVALSLRRALELCQRLDVRCYEPVVLAHQARVLALKGRRQRAEERAQRAVDLCAEYGSQFFGPIALVVLAEVTEDRATCERALEQAAAILESGAWSHCHLIFYRGAMEVALQNDEPAWVERYAGALEHYTLDEPLAWSQFFVDRARVLVRHARGEPVAEELARVLVQARKLGMHTPANALNEALMQYRDI